MDEFERAVESIYVALNGKVEKERIRKELRKWITQYGVSISEAKRSIVSNYGGDVRELQNSIKAVNELSAGEGRVNLRVKVLSINPKEYEVDGTKKIMHYGLIGDESGVIPFTAWKLDVELRKGDCVEITNAYTKEWQDRVTLVIGQNTRLKLLPPDSVKVKMEIKPSKIVELHPKMGLVEVVGKIMSVDEREIEVDGVPRKIYSGIIADDTGEIIFTSWDVPVQKDKVLKISGAYVSTFRGMPQLVLDNRSHVEEVDREIEIKDIPVNIESLEGKGGLNVLIEGVVIDIKDGSGLISRCPECGRVLTGTNCPVHGKVTPKPDLRIKAIIDDGTGAVLALFNREMSEEALGMSFHEILEKAKENIGYPSMLVDEIEEKLIARPIMVRGNVSSDPKYGLRMFVNEFRMLNLEDIAKKAEKMLEEMGW